MKRKKFNPSSLTLPPLQNSPLDLFPTKGDIIRSNFIRKSSRRSNASKSLTSIDDNNDEEGGQWLHADKIPDKNVSFVVCLHITYIN